MLRRSAHGETLPANWCRDTALKLHGKFSCHPDSSASLSLVTRESHVLLVPVTREVTVPVLTSSHIPVFFLQPAKTQNLPSPGGPTGEAEAKEDKSRWSAFCHGRSVWKIRPVQEATPGRIQLRPASPLCSLHVGLVPKLSQSTTKVSPIVCLIDVI